VDASASANAVDELAKTHVVAIVGPIDEDAVDAAGGRAEGLGIPLLSLSSRPEARTMGAYVFHVRHSAEMRARILARRALAKGVTSFYVMAADTGYGKAVAAAFENEVQKGSGTVAGTVTYAKDTKSFDGKAKQLSGSFQAVFVADNAEDLELIVPALATAGYFPKPLGTKKVVGGRPILLLSTAEGLTAQYVANAGRYSEGAMLAPGYYPDQQDPTSKAFVDKYAAAFGRAPGAIEAYAYDAAQLAAAAAAGGRNAAATTLSNAQLDGVTGTIKFDSNHLRADPGVIYTVVDDNGSYAIRIQR
jgi:branched-chain amino acid transport system substrate-binding protein